MKPGDVLPTVLQLQSTYHVSQATVERALDRLRREGLVVRPAGQMRLVVAEQSDPAAQRVAMIRPDYPSPPFEELSRVIVDAGKRKDWAFELVSFRNLDRLNLRRAIGDNDAAILLPTSEPFPDHLQAALRRPRQPVVVIQDPPPNLRVSSVRLDDVQVGRLATKHLAALGHGRILFFQSEPHGPSGDLRQRGWREQMLAMGQENLDELVVDAGLRPFDNSVLKSYEFFSRWIEGRRPVFTAIFCSAWTGGVAVLRVLREHGLRVPKDVSVIAHGGESSIGPFLSPALTAVESDLVEYGQLVVKVLQRQLDEQPHPMENLTVPSTLVLRESTAKAPDSSL
jgi:LacI family transcriptional regulator